MAKTATTASRISSDGVSRRSRQPFELNRKLGVFAVAAAITASSTQAMAISRERRTVVRIRAAGDLLLGRSIAAVSRSTAGSACWDECADLCVEVSLIAVS